MRFFFSIDIFLLWWNYNTTLYLIILANRTKNWNSVFIKSYKTKTIQCIFRYKAIHFSIPEQDNLSTCRPCGPLVVSVDFLPPKCVIGGIFPLAFLLFLFTTTNWSGLFHLMSPVGIFEETGSNAHQTAQRLLFIRPFGDLSWGRDPTGILFLSWHSRRKYSAHRHVFRFLCLPSRPAATHLE